MLWQKGGLHPMHSLNTEAAACPVAWYHVLKVTDHRRPVRGRKLDVLVDYQGYGNAGTPPDCSRGKAGSASTHNLEAPEEPPIQDRGN